MKTRDQLLEELRIKYDILIQAVHEMNEMIHQLRDENEQLKKIIEELDNE